MIKKKRQKQALGGIYIRKWTRKNALVVKRVHWFVRMRVLQWKNIKKGKKIKPKYIWNIARVVGFVLQFVR